MNLNQIEGRKCDCGTYCSDADKGNTRETSEGGSRGIVIAGGNSNISTASEGGSGHIADDSKTKGLNEIDFADLGTYEDESLGIDMGL